MKSARVLPLSAFSPPSSFHLVLESYTYEETNCWKHIRKERARARTSGPTTCPDTGTQLPSLLYHAPAGKTARSPTPAGTTRACSAFTRPHAHTEASTPIGGMHTTPTSSTVTYTVAIATYFWNIQWPTSACTRTRTRTHNNTNRQCGHVSACT
jgi:hypothetical protein